MGFLHPHKPSDYPSFLLYVLDETHVTVTATTAVILLWTRDAHVAWFALGAVGASQLAKGIKRLIREPRPPPPPPTFPSDYQTPADSADSADSEVDSSAERSEADAEESHSTSTNNLNPKSSGSTANSSHSRPRPRHPVRPKKTYGMPSTHSTALTFFFIYLFPIIPDIFNHLSSFSSPFSSSSSTTTTNTPGTNTNTTAVTIARLLLTLAWSAGLWSRRELGYHTWAQIAGGALVGSVSAVMWGKAWHLGNERHAFGLVGLVGGHGHGQAEADGWLRFWIQGWIDAVWEGTVGRVIG